MKEEETGITYSEYSGDYPVNGEDLAVLIYKPQRDPEWVLEVITARGASAVWSKTFISDRIAWKIFEETVKNEGLEAFFDKNDPGMTDR